ncbi:hypothetical protein E2C01_030347 [Portunus trituberculatus]|uniref:Uncharacterized protein n=1 Tax=Portunus trituberculatus TaxID=210409 RepID=A0A5B7EUM4_PORTR|nr:hypothetical protein [Portunus trituberculatus]
MEAAPSRNLDGPLMRGFRGRTGIGRHFFPAQMNTEIFRESFGEESGKQDEMIVARLVPRIHSAKISPNKKGTAS